MRKPVSGFLALVCLATGLAWLFLARTSSAELVDPSGNGDRWLYCNGTMGDNDGDWHWSDTDGVTLRFACQYHDAGLAPLTHVGFSYLHRRDGGAQGVSSAISQVGPSPGSWVTVESHVAGQIKFRVDVPAGGGNQPDSFDGLARSSPQVVEFLESGVTPSACALASGNNAYLAPPTYKPGCLLSFDRTSSSEWPEMPSQYFSGGVGYDPTSGYAHGLTCERTMFQDASGAWWVTLFGSDTETPVQGSTRQKVWTGSWDTESGVVGQPAEGDTQNRVTVPLPSLGAKPPGGWWAVFHQRVKFPSGYSAPPPVVTGNGELRQDDDDFWWWWTSAAAAGIAVNGTVPAGAAPLWSALGPALGASAAGYLLGRAVQSWVNASDPAELDEGSSFRAPFGARYFNGGSQTDGTTDYTEYEVVCTVSVDPENPSLSGGSPVQPPRGEGVAGGPEEQSPASGGCGAGPLGDVPLIGGLFDGFARLLCGLADVLGRLFSFLRDLLIPDDIEWESLTDALDDGFPFNIVTGLVEGLAGVATSFTTAIDAGDACPEIDVGEMIDYGERPGGPEIGLSGQVPLRLPTPASVSCPGYAQAGEAWTHVGDLFGFADSIRTLLTFLLYLGFAFSVIRAVSRNDPDEVEVGV